MGWRGGDDTRGLSFRERAAHVAVQVNGNHWLRLNPPLLDEADIFMYSSQLVRSVHLQMQTLIPPRRCSMLILLEYFILRALSLSPTMSFLAPSCSPSIISLSRLEVVCCRCRGKSVFKSFLLTDSLDLLSTRRPQETAESTLRNNNTVDFFFCVFTLSTNTNSFADSFPCERFFFFFQSLKVASLFSLIPSAMPKPSLWFCSTKIASGEKERRHLKTAGKDTCSESVVI